MPKINRKAFIESLRFVSAAIIENSPKPVLQYALLDIHGGFARLTATDQEIRIGCKIECEGEIHCLVPAGKLTDLLSACQNEEFDISLSSCGIKIVDSSGSYRFVTPPIDEFPTVKQSYEMKCKTDSVYLGRAMPLVMSCVTEKVQSKFTIEGVRFESIEGSVWMVSTDINRICACKICNGEIEGFTLPLKATKVVARLEGQVSFGCNDGIATFLTADKFVVSRTLHNNFPRGWPAVMDEAQSQPVWGVSRSDLESGLRKSAVYSDVDSRGIHMTIEKNKTLIMARGTDVGQCGMEIPGGCEKQQTVKVNGLCLYQFVTKIPTSAAVTARVGDKIAFSVGDFCQFCMATMEEVE